jgi:hypothetical protein
MNDDIAILGDDLLKFAPGQGPAPSMNAPLVHAHVPEMERFPGMKRLQGFRLQMLECLLLDHLG